MTCIFPNCTSNAVTNNYCIGHSKMMGSVTIKEKSKIPVQSDKRKEEQKEYRKIVAEMLRANPDCEIKQPGCQVKATGLHHQRKRTPATFLDKRYLIRSCDSCNLWAELNPVKALKKGISISKFTPDEVIK